MSFDDNGNYNRINGTTGWEDDRDQSIPILASRHDADANDTAEALNETFLRDGRAPAAGNFKMGGYKVTGMGNAAAQADAATAGQVQTNAFNSGNDISGEANAVKVNLAPALASLANNFILFAKIANDNTGATTLKVNALEAKPVYIGTGDIYAGALKAGETYMFFYNASLQAFQLFTSGAVLGSQLPLFSKIQLDYLLRGDAALGWELQGTRCYKSKYWDAYNQLVTEYEDIETVERTETIGETTFSYKLNGVTKRRFYTLNDYNARFELCGDSGGYVLDQETYSFYLPKNNNFERLSADTEVLGAYVDDTMRPITGEMIANRENSGTSEEGTWDDGKALYYGKMTNRRGSGAKDESGNSRSIKIDSGRLGANFAGTQTQPKSKLVAVYYRAGGVYAEPVSNAVMAAETAAKAAQASASSAAGSSSAASTSASNAQGSAAAAGQSADNASVSEDGAATAAAEGAQSAATAATKAGEALASASNAADSEIAAQTAQGIAESARDDAQAAKTAAETAQGKAETARGAAEEAANNAKESETNAASSAEDAEEALTELLTATYTKIQIDNKVNAKQDKLTATGATNVLTAPTAAGGQPGVKAISDFVQTTGDQTVAGTKTFGTSPVVPSKTTTAANTGAAIATEAQVYNEAQRAAQAEGNIASGLANEIIRATTAEGSNAGAITTEVSRAKDAEQALASSKQANLTAEQLAVVNENPFTDDDKNAISGNTSAIGAETERAEEAEEDLQEAIDAEETRATTAEGGLQTAISSEATRASGAESALQTAISNEATRATTAESGLQTAINTEASTRASADSAINAKIPSAASSSNQLADKDFVNSSIINQASNSVYADAAGNQFASRAALLAADTFYRAGAAYTPSNNDYTIILADEGAPAPFTGGQTRWKWSGSPAVLGYEFGINETPFTTAQNNAINSGMTAALKTKLDGIAAGAQVNTITSVAGKTGAVTLAKADVGLGNVDNTSDANKPVSTAAQAALDNKVDKVSGKGLSANDYTAAEKTKLAAVAAGAQVNVLEGVQLNGSDLAVSNKKVNVVAQTPLSTKQLAVVNATPFLAAEKTKLANITEGTPPDNATIETSAGLLRVKPQTTLATIVESTAKFAASTTLAFGDFFNNVVAKVNGLITTVGNKLDKKTTSGDFAYIHNGSSQNEKAYTLAPTPSTIAERTSSGTLRAATATDGTDLVPLAQMNTAIADAEIVGGKSIGELYWSPSDSTADNPGGVMVESGPYFSNGSALYPTLYAKLKTGTLQSATTTKEDYDAEIASTGECYKYVIDEVAGSIRFPKIKKLEKISGPDYDNAVTLQSDGNLPVYTSPYTVQENGYICMVGYDAFIGHFAMRVNGVGVGAGGWDINNNTKWGGAYCQVNKGDVITFTFSTQDGSSDNAGFEHSIIKFVPQKIIQRPYCPWIFTNNQAVQQTTATIEPDKLTAPIPQFASFEYQGILQGQAAVGRYLAGSTITASMFTPTGGTYTNPIDKLEADYQSGTAGTITVNGVDYTVITGGTLGFKYLASADWNTLNNAGNLPSRFYGRASSTSYILPMPARTLIADLNNAGATTDNGTMVSQNLKLYSNGDQVLEFKVIQTNSSWKTLTHTYPFAGTKLDIKSLAQWNWDDSATNSSTANNGANIGYRTQSSFQWLFAGVGTTENDTGTIRQTGKAVPATLAKFAIPSTYYQLADSGLDDPAQLAAADIVAKVNNLKAFVDAQFPGWNS